MQDLIGYVKGLGDSPSTTNTSAADATHATIVLQTVEDLLEVANNQSLHNVRLNSYGM